MKQSIKQNLILVIMTLMTLMLAFFIGLGLTMPSVVALEQDARCGITEHVHRDECYLNNVLICGQKAHTHGENCYLLRLEDNDINRLLSEIEVDEEKSLEHVITNVVYKASYLELVSEGLLPAPTPTPTPTPTPLLALLPAGSSLDSLTATNEGVANLNRSIVENNITPTIYLNERLITPASEGEEVTPDKNLVNLIEGETSPTDLVTFAAGGNSTDNGGISLLAVGDSAATNGNNVNVYIYLDEESFVCLGYTALQRYRVVYTSNSRYYAATANNIANLFAGGTVPLKTAITSGNILYSNYLFDYYRGSSAPTNTNSFATPAVAGNRENGNSFGFSTNAGIHNALLTDKSGTPINFYTVTLKYDEVDSARNDDVQYVQSGQDSTLTLNSDYLWYDKPVGGNQMTAEDLKNITDTTTLYAKPKEITVSFYAEDGTTLIPPVIKKNPGSDGKISVTLISRENALWIVKGSDGSKYWPATGTVTLELSTSTDFMAVPAFYDVTYKDNEGKETPTKVAYSGNATMPDLPAGWLWQSGSSYYSVGESVPISSNTTFTAVEGCSVTFVDANGNVDERIVKLNTSVQLPSLPSGYYWYNEYGTKITNEFNATRDITLHAYKPIKVTYHVDPNGTVDELVDSVSGAEIKPRAPTVSGSNSTTLTEEIIPSPNITLRNAAPSKLTALSAAQADNGYYIIGHFVGWKVGNSDTILPANSSYTYDELAAYADNNGNITLNGVWEEGWPHSANFFIKFDSILDGNLSAGKYTPSLFTAYVGYNGYTPAQEIIAGNDKADQTSEAVIAADTAIRARLGANDKTGKDSVYLYDMPSDDQVFAALKEYVKASGASSQLQVEGVPVSVDELNSDTFAVRWYVFKFRKGSGWHVDGILVRKVGKIHVTKTFDGRENLVKLAKDPNFKIDATNGTVTKTLYLRESNNYGADGGYVLKDANGNTLSIPEKNYFVWEITDVHANEEWTITEYPVDISGSVDFGEWLIVDSTNSQGGGGVGTQTIVKGVTFPKDVGSDEWLRADFTNVYLSESSILIRKVDGQTGARIDGAVFEFWQGGRIMTFNKDSDNRYVFQPNGDGIYTQLVADGTEIAADRFTYDKGTITIREIAAPAGYAVSGEVQIERTSSATDAPIVIVNDVNLDPDDPADLTKPDYIEKVYAYYENGVLVIKNFTSTMNVTAQKEWRNCHEEEYADTVTVQLMAKDSNGEYSASLAASVLPAGTKTIQTLKIQRDSDGNFTGYSTYTWENLPEYINGAKAEWSIKELAIGDEQIKADGTFPNWNSYVSLPTESIENGVKTATITVTNIPKTGTELRLIKKDNFNRPIPGVTFVLKDKDGTKVLNTLTTDANGELIFHNLKYATQYTLVEENIPEAYWGYTDPIKVTINEDGTVTILDGSPPNAKPSAQNYTIEVINYTGEPLPETGGTGTHIYTAGGLLLMAAATALLIYRRKRRKEVDLLDV